MKQRLINILFWSVISAAFIGPGTVTTAASAGAVFGYALIWALIFSTAACYVLQEASARITAVSNMNLGEAMRSEYGSSRSGRWLIGLALVAILSGCTAFEAGNILGAVEGISLINPSLPVPVVVCIGLLFGIMELQPVPVIILAQALNGIILPVIAVILFLLMNNINVLPRNHQNGTSMNLITGVVVWLTILIGLTTLLRALSGTGGFDLPDQSILVIISVVLFFIVIAPIIKIWFKRDSPFSR